MMQNELFKRYHEKNKKNKKTFDEMALEYTQAKDFICELESKIKIYEDFMIEIENKNKDSIENKLVNYSQRIALLDSSMIKITRKYDCLQSDEKELRKAY
jgi:hypothetical protein